MCGWREQQWVSMSRGPATFKASDVTKAIKAVMAAGVEVARVEIDKQGKIVVVPGQAIVTEKGLDDMNEWDEA
jgi:hypothetical protein